MSDNYELWEANERRESKWLSLRPKCCVCDEHIQEETLFEIEYELYCEDCARERFQRITEDYILEE